MQQDNTSHCIYLKDISPLKPFPLHCHPALELGGLQTSNPFPHLLWDLSLGRSSLCPPSFFLIPAYVLFSRGATWIQAGLLLEHQKLLRALGETSWEATTTLSQHKLLEGTWLSGHQTQ